MRKVDLIVIALAAPIQIGVYVEDVLDHVLESDQQASEYLPEVFKTLLERYEISSITYAKGPGSFMAIKMSYLFLKSLEIINDIELRAALAFEFNDFSPIKALGKLYFHYENGEIATRPLGDAVLMPMQLPKVYDKENYSMQTEPEYILPAVN